MKPYLDRQLFPARAALFHEGQLGDRLYLLARGAVSIVAEDPGAKGKHRRVVTLAPGVIFGESAMMKGGTRAVTAIAEEARSSTACRGAISKRSTRRIPTSIDGCC